jgi:hypothetical protein
VAFPFDPFRVTLRDSILFCGTLATSPHLPNQTLASHSTATPFVLVLVLVVVLDDFGVLRLDAAFRFDAA